MARQTAEERAVTDAFGGSAKAVIDLVNARLVPVADLNAWRLGVDANLSKLNACCDEVKASQAPRPAAPQPARQPTPVAREVRFVADPRTWGWGWLAWALAIIGLFVGLLVAKYTFGWLFWLTDPVQWAGIVLSVIWWGGFAILGFFLGGEIGARIWGWIRP
jgi:hypothetical protein